MIDGILSFLNEAFGKQTPEDVEAVKHEQVVKFNILLHPYGLKVGDKIMFRTSDDLWASMHTIESELEPGTIVGAEEIGRSGTSALARILTPVVALVKRAGGDITYKIDAELLKNKLVKEAFGKMTPEDVKSVEAEFQQRIYWNKKAAGNAADYRHECPVCYGKDIELYGTEEEEIWICETCSSKWAVEFDSLGDAIDAVNKGEDPDIYVIGWYLMEERGVLVEATDILKVGDRVEYLPAKPEGQHGKHGRVTKITQDHKDAGNPTDWYSVEFQHTPGMIQDGIPRTALRKVGRTVEAFGKMTPDDVEAVDAENKRIRLLDKVFTRNKVAQKAARAIEQYLSSGAKYGTWMELRSFAETFVQFRAHAVHQGDSELRMLWIGVAKSAASRADGLNRYVTPFLFIRVFSNGYILLTKQDRTDRKAFPPTWLDSTGRHLDNVQYCDECQLVLGDPLRVAQGGPFEGELICPRCMQTPTIVEAFGKMTPDDVEKVEQENAMNKIRVGDKVHYIGRNAYGNNRGTVLDVYGSDYPHRYADVMFDMSVGRVGTINVRNLRKIPMHWESKDYTITRAERKLLNELY